MRLRCLRLRIIFAKSIRHSVALRLPATALKGHAGLRLDATLKHLTALRDARVLVTTPDRQDKRRMLYSLAPSVPVVRTETGTAIHFGYCVLLCQGTIQLAGIPLPVPLTGKD